MIVIVHIPPISTCGAVFLAAEVLHAISPSLDTSRTENGLTEAFSESILTFAASEADAKVQSSEITVISDTFTLHTHTHTHTQKHTGQWLGELASRRASPSPLG